MSGKKRMPDPGGNIINVTVGTAGHIDHGKTELIKLLTGCDTDALPEEKARGMTIDLGFARCALPGGQGVGIVDVPGHERFIHNMVAGVTGIDIVLLVVAADDGVMPQTVEHFDIVRLLGVSRGMVAITKTDLVQPARIEEVRAEVVELLRNSLLRDAPVVAVSSKTGEGFETFKKTFVDVVAAAGNRDVSGAFRFPVERSFVLQGKGVIVSGIPRSGVVGKGDSLQLFPGDTVCRVRGLQVYGNDSVQGRSGECVALNLGGLERADIGRGSVLFEPGAFTPCRFVNAVFKLIPNAECRLESRTKVRLHIGTTEAIANIMLPTLEPMNPGEEKYVQIDSPEPLLTAPGDPYIVRQLNPPRTIGGGHVVSPDRMRMRRTRGDWAGECRKRDEAFANHDTAVLYVMEHSDPRSFRSDEIARCTAMRFELVGDVLKQLVDSGDVIALGKDRYAWPKHVRLIKKDLVGILSRMHDETPLQTGFHASDVFKQCRFERVLLNRAVGELEDENVIVRNDAGLSLLERTPVLSTQQSRIAEALLRLFRKAGYVTPRIEELPELLKMSRESVMPVLDHLVETGRIIRVSPKVLVHAEHMNEAWNRMMEYFHDHERIETTTFKEMLGTTRKYAIGILEYWDAMRLTRRIDNARVLRDRSARDPRNVKSAT